MKPKGSPVEEIIGFNFHNKHLLEQALTYRSYVNENSSSTGHNERLEFLGDATLEFVIAQYLYKNFPDKQEGELTEMRSSIVNNVMLSTIAEDIGIGEFIRVSKGERMDWQKNSKARSRILASTIEALIGAIYLDRNALGLVELFVLEYIIPNLKIAIANRMRNDPKSFLQNYAQEKYKFTPEYVFLDESGPDHNKQFRMEVRIGENVIGNGLGSSK